MRDLFDVLSMDERQIVYSSVEEKCIYTWNQSATLQCWQQLKPNHWEEVAIQTLSHSPASFEEARKAAIRWATGG